MAGLPFGFDPTVVTGDKLKPILDQAGISLPRHLIGEYVMLLNVMEASLKKLGSDKGLELLRPDESVYPRSKTVSTETNHDEGWATQTVSKCIRPETNLLQGLTLALKDNIALAGVPCTNGTSSLPTWTPAIDATVATRVMDAGGTIMGKATCENASLEGISCTSVSGPVRNPLTQAVAYSAGGSSSGCARLVALRLVDMAVGCDQTGSIRVPSAACGIVGFKPSWGLVPYTGIVGLDPTLDHAGPMASTVRHAALLLDVIAGRDGWDDSRQAPEGCGKEHGSFQFVQQVDTFLSLSQDRPLQGFKIGVLIEAFQQPGQDANVVRSIRSAVDRLRSLGASVSEVSVPLHADAPTLLLASLPPALAAQGLLGTTYGAKQLYMPDRAKTQKAQGGDRLAQAQFDALSPNGQLLYLTSLWVKEKHGTEAHGRGMNLAKAITDAYDEALQNVQVLVMPTTSRLPPQLPPSMSSTSRKEGPSSFVARTAGLVNNTAPFSASGHPALSLPVGLCTVAGSSRVKLPAAMQIVGRRYHDIDCLTVAAAWERAFDWRDL